jgi:hypothetical protein
MRGLDAHFPGQPDGQIDFFLMPLADGPFRAVVGKRHRRGQARVIQKILLILRQYGMRADHGAVRQGVEHSQQVGTALGMRQEGLVAQRDRGALQVFAGAFRQVQADQIDHALAGVFQIGAQMSGAEMVGDLHDALGTVGEQRFQPARREDVVLESEAQRFNKERTGVERRDVSGTLGHAFPRFRWRILRPRRAAGRRSVLRPGPGGSCGHAAG